MECFLQVTKREADKFLMSLASLGLKSLVSIIAEDKQLAAAAKKSYHHFHRNLVSLNEYF